DFNDVKIVILGQDPYHGPNQAHGLSFSVPVGEKIPPSLRNIYKELASDSELAVHTPEHGCLSHWADQGVLLLNAILTVEANQPGSHQKQGWEQFTDAIIRQLNQRRQHLVFMLWGKYAQDKGKVIDSNRHLVLQTTHPSPLSAYRGFLGCGHFSKANTWLIEHDKTPIHW
ncbi:MAG: uracil-DNA glycosylase, partial [Mariprofundus sp.]|nr:uracil-DNA glycosylase [Mariprofundus sp.]